MNINIVIPIAGMGSRFVKAGYTVPKPFIDVLGKSMIQHVIENLSYDDADYTIIARKEHMKDYSKALEDVMGGRRYTVIEIDRITEGAVCTVLYAHRRINNNTPLMIANSDQIVDIKISDYIEDWPKRGLDGSIMTFVDTKMDPKWSFAKVENGLVSEVREKVPISDLATVGIYLFSKGSDFVNASLDMIVRNERVNNEFYVCPTYNYAIKNGLRIGVYTIREAQMHGIGTPADLDSYKKIMNRKV